ncbi:MAG: GMC family oxidoreductase, partial [Pseudomonadota bacterium]
AAIYYAQTTGGRGVVRSLPGFDDPLVRVRHDPVDMQNLAEGLRRLAECLLAAGAEAIYPNVAGCPPLRSMADLRHLPDELPSERVSLTTLHMFSSCPMGEARERTVANSFGKVHDVDDLHLADASLLCGPTVVNPQGTIMALAHRNVVHFLESRRH